MTSSKKNVDVASEATANRPGVSTPGVHHLRTSLTEQLRMPEVAEPRAYPLRKKKVDVWHGYQIRDDYAAMREMPDPDALEKGQLVLSAPNMNLVRDEQAYYAAVMKPLEKLTHTLVEELKAQIEDESTGPEIDQGKQVTWTEYKAGTNFPVYKRRNIEEADAPIQTLVDAEFEAGGNPNYALYSFSVSPDDKKIAILADHEGSEKMHCRIRDIETGKLIEELNNLASSCPLWSQDNEHLFYVPQHEEDGRMHEVRLHKIGTEQSNSRCIYRNEEQNVSLQYGDDNNVVIGAGNFLSNELYIASVEHLEQPPRLVKSIEHGTEYYLTFGGGKVWMRINDEHKNFRIAAADVDKLDHWNTLLSGSDELYITDIEAFDHHLLISARENGLEQLIVHDFESNENIRIPIEDNSYTAQFANNQNPASRKVRYQVSSMRMPETTFEFDVATRKTSQIHQKKICDGYNPAEFATERLMLPSRDGKNFIPVSLAYRKEAKEQGKLKNAIASVYGAYGKPLKPGFNYPRVLMMRRDYLSIIIHGRGGDDLGIEWKKQGMLDKRPNAFYDTIDAIEGLVNLGWVQRGHVALVGVSAGGGMVANVINTHPDLFGVASADVPFVDILQCVLDENAPRAKSEHVVLGNPVKSKKELETIYAWSPVEQAGHRQQDVPPLRITTAMLDRRVPWFGPVIWGRTLRDSKTSSTPVVIKMDDRGHFNQAGRYDLLHDIAENYAFILTYNGKKIPAAPASREPFAPLIADEAEQS